MKTQRNTHGQAPGDCLARLPLLYGLPPRLIDRLAGGSITVEMPAGKILFAAGDSVRKVFALVQGTVKRTAFLASDIAKVIELVQSPEWIAMSEVLGIRQHASTVETLTPCLLVSIDLALFHDLVRNNADLRERVILALAKRQRSIEFDSSGFHRSQTVAQRLLDFLVDLAGKPDRLAGETTLRLAANRKILASRIGVAPETLSRSLRQLRESGVIVVEGRNIHIQNAALLETVAGPASQPINFSRQHKLPGSPGKRKMSAGTLVNLCGRPRMLSQRSAVAWALLGRNIAATRARVKIRQLDSEFTRNIARLLEGVPSASLEKRLHGLNELWSRYRKALFDPATLPSRVLALSEEILDAADRLTAEAERRCNLPAAHQVNIAGRNRMLTQRISKYFIFRELGEELPDLTDMLDACCNEFDKNLAELRRCRTPCPEVKAQLDVVDESWLTFQAILKPEFRHSAKSRHVKMVLGVGESLLRHLDTAVKLYERLAR